MPASWEAGQRSSAGHPPQTFTHVFSHPSLLPLCLQTPSKPPQWPRRSCTSLLLPSVPGSPGTILPPPSRNNTITYEHSLYTKRRSKQLAGTDLSNLHSNPRLQVWSSLLFDRWGHRYREARARAQGHAGSRWEARSEPRQPGFRGRLYPTQIPEPEQLLSQVNEGRRAGILSGSTFRTQLQSPVLDQVCPLWAPVAPWVPLLPHLPLLPPSSRASSGAVSSSFHTLLLSWLLTWSEFKSLQ